MNQWSTIGHRSLSLEFSLEFSKQEKKVFLFPALFVFQRAPEATTYLEAVSEDAPWK